MWGSKAMSLQKENGSWVPSWFYIAPARSGVYAKVWLSFLPVLMWDLFVDPMCRSCLASFWISFNGNCSMDSCTFGVPLGRREFRNLLCHHLCSFLRIARLQVHCRQREDNVLKRRECSESNHPLGSSSISCRSPSVDSDLESLHSPILHSTLSNSYSENSIF